MLNSPHREAVEAIVVVLGIHTRRIEVQVATIRTRIQSRSPVVAVRATIVQRRTIVVASGRKENTPLSVITCYDQMKELHTQSHHASLIFPANPQEET